MARPIPWLGPAVWVGGLLPLGVMGVDAFTGALGAEPITAALNQLGLLTLATLLLSLGCTPLKAISGWTWPIRIRRTLGLIAYIDGCAHFLTYSVLSKGLNWPVIWKDVTQRPFTVMGMGALLVLTPLAITSTAKMVKRLGFVRWKRLHRLVYLAGVFGVIHYIWRVKKDRTEPYLYATVLGFFFLIRIVDALRTRPKARPAPAT